MNSTGLQLRKKKTNNCYYCGRRFKSNDEKTADHVIPSILGGPDNSWNIVISCRKCNHAKGSKIFEEFTGQAKLPRHCRRHYETTWEFMKTPHFNMGLFKCMVAAKIINTMPRSQRAEFFKARPDYYKKIMDENPVSYMNGKLKLKQRKYKRIEAKAKRKGY